MPAKNLNSNNMNCENGISKATRKRNCTSDSCINGMVVNVLCDNVIEPNKEWQQESSHSKVQMYKSEWCFQRRRQTHNGTVLCAEYVYTAGCIHSVQCAQTINKKFCRYIIIFQSAPKVERGEWDNRIKCELKRKQEDSRFKSFPIKRKTFFCLSILKVQSKGSPNNKFTPRIQTGRTVLY